MEVIFPLAIMLLIGWWASRNEDKKNARKELERKQKRESDPFYDAERLRQELLRWMNAREKNAMRPDDARIQSDTQWLATKRLAGFDSITISKEDSSCISINGRYHCSDENIRKLGFITLDEFRQGTHLMPTRSKLPR